VPIVAVEGLLRIAAERIALYRAIPEEAAASAPSGTYGAPRRPAQG
jgi:hypothetical protein